MRVSLGTTRGQPTFIGHLHMPDSRLGTRVLGGQAPALQLSLLIGSPETPAGPETLTGGTCRREVAASSWRSRCR